MVLIYSFLILYCILLTYFFLCMLFSVLTFAPVEKRAKIIKIE